MKIYNKKGFGHGMVLAVLGVVRLVMLVVAPEEQWAQLMKGLILGLVFLLLGLMMLLRALSKSATREDIIDDNDERNILIKLKVQACTASVLCLTFVLFMVVGLVGFVMTNNEAWTLVFTVPAVFLIVYIIASIVATVYYEKRV